MSLIFFPHFVRKYLKKQLIGQSLILAHGFSSSLADCTVAGTCGEHCSRQSGGGGVLKSWKQVIFFKICTPCDSLFPTRPRHSVANSAMNSSGYQSLEEVSALVI